MIVVVVVAVVGDTCILVITFRRSSMTATTARLRHVCPPDTLVSVQTKHARSFSLTRTPTLSITLADLHAHSSNQIPPPASCNSFVPYPSAPGLPCLMYLVYSLAQSGISSFRSRCRAPPSSRCTSHTRSWVHHNSAFSFRPLLLCLSSPVPPHRNPHRLLPLAESRYHPMGNPNPTPGILITNNETTKQ